MAYPAELLSEGETIEFEMRPHWRALLMPLTVTVLVLVGVTVLTVLWGGWFEGAVGTVGRWVVLGVGRGLGFGGDAGWGRAVGLGVVRTGAAGFGGAWRTTGAGRAGSGSGSGSGSSR